MKYLKVSGDDWLEYILQGAWHSCIIGGLFGRTSNAFFVLQCAILGPRIQFDRLPWLDVRLAINLIQRNVTYDVADLAGVSSRTALASLL